MHRVRSIALTAILLVGPRLVQAQDGVVAGTVVVTGSQRPLPGAQVVVIGVPNKGAATDAIDYHRGNHAVRARARRGRLEGEC